MKFFRNAKRNVNPRLQERPVQPLESRRLLSAAPAMPVPSPIMSAAPVVTIDQGPHEFAARDMVNMFLAVTGTPGGSVFPPISAGPMHGFGFDDGSIAHDVSNGELPPFYFGLLGNPLVISSGTTSQAVPASTISATDIKPITDNILTAHAGWDQDAPTATAASHVEVAGSTTSNLDAANIKLSADATIQHIATPTATNAPENIEAKLTTILSAIQGVESKLAVLAMDEASTIAQSAMRTIEADLVSVGEIAGNMISQLVRDMAIDMGHRELEALGDSLNGSSIWGWQSWQSATAITGTIVAAIAYLKSEAETSETKSKSIFSNRMISTDAMR